MGLNFIVRSGAVSTLFFWEVFAPEVFFL